MLYRIRKMSRIGNKGILLPSSVSLNWNEKEINIKGTYGNLNYFLPKGISLEQTETLLFVKRSNDTKKIRSLHGLTRALIQNMIIGVSEKFSKVLLVEGVGYRFQLTQNNLVLLMGYSHPIEIAIPKDLTIVVESPTKIIISGINKERVGFFASQIREVRLPEPYKGKGIRYENEILIRKAGKTGK